MNFTTTHLLLADSQWNEALTMLAGNSAFGRQYHELTHCYFSKSFEDRTGFKTLCKLFGHVKPSEPHKPSKRPRRSKISQLATVPAQKSRVTVKVFNMARGQKLSFRKKCLFYRVFASCQLSKTILSIFCQMNIYIYNYIYILYIYYIYIYLEGYDNSQQLGQCPKHLFQVISSLFHVAAPCPAVLLRQTQMSKLCALRHGAFSKSAPLFGTKETKHTDKLRANCQRRTHIFGVAPKKTSKNSKTTQM